MANLLSIGKTGLFAAQQGMATTGNNITNANVAGYSRQLVIQTAGAGQNMGGGFVGSGTQVSDIRRYSDPFMTTQVRNATSHTSSLTAHAEQLTQVDNLLADTTSGLSPALQDFFKSVQDLSASPGSTASRQALLSGADAMVARFQGLDGRMQEVRQGVEAQIGAKVTLINSYGAQIAELNEQIAGASASGQGLPNDLLDARDQLVLELNKQVKATVTNGDNNSITVSIGSGQPLVVGKRSFELAAMNSPTDPGRTEVGYVTGSKVTMLSESSLKGGELGGLFEFRSGSLDRAQNSLGRIAIALGTAFNAQHALGVDGAGNPGQPFFKVGEATATPSRLNVGTGVVGATITDPAALSQSDYRVGFDGSKYTVTRLMDNQTTVINPYPQTTPQTIDGVAFSVSTGASAGDNFLVRPTANGASSMALLLTDRSQIAAGMPIAAATGAANKGSGTITDSGVTAGYQANPLTAPVTLSYSATTGGLSGFPAGQAVTVKLNNTTTTYPAGTTPIPFAAGASYAFGGVTMALAGAPVDGDTFSVRPETQAVGDNRNMNALARLQTANIMEGGKASLQGGYAELVSFVGNKTREVQVNSAAGEVLLKRAVDAQQNVAGVNLDEEAANLLRYQQAYQAAGKVMQMASSLFDVLLTLGR